MSLLQLVHSSPLAHRAPLARRRPRALAAATATADLFDSVSAASPPQTMADAPVHETMPAACMNQGALPRPHQNCYWVVPGVLMAGEYPGADAEEVARARVGMIAAAGVRHFVDLTEAHELAPYHPHLPLVSRTLERPVAHERWSIRDVDVPHSIAHANHILDRIDALVTVNAVPYVHCWGGVGRTGTIIGCWLVRHGKSGEEALGIIAEHWTTMAKRRRHPRSPETDAQRRFVLEWAGHDRLRLGRAGSV